MIAGQSAGSEVAVEYQAPFVFPVIAPEEGQPAAKPLRLVAGYSSSEQSGITKAHGSDSILKNRWSCIRLGETSMSLYLLKEKGRHVSMVSIFSQVPAKSSSYGFLSGRECGIAFGICLILSVYLQVHCSWFVPVARAQMSPLLLEIWTLPRTRGRARR